MACKIATPTNQVRRAPALLPQQLPTKQSEWSRFLSILNGWYRSLQGASQQSSANVIPAQYSTFQGASAPALTVSNCTGALDSTHTLYGSNALKVSVTATGATLEFTGYPIVMEAAQKWYCAFRIYTASAITGSLEVLTNNANSVTETFSISASTDFQTIWSLFDLSQYSDTKATWKFTFNTVADFWIDGLQMNTIGSVFLGASSYAITQAPGSMNEVPDTSTRYAAITANANNTASEICGAGAAIVEDVCYDGVAYTFPQDFNATPIIIFGAGGLTYDSSLTGSQSQAYSAESVTTRSFIPRLKIQELSGTTTNQSQNFSPYNAATTSASLTLSAVAWDGNYTFNFTGTLGSGDIVTTTFSIVMNGVTVWTKNFAGTGGSSQSYSVTLTNTAVAAGNTIEITAASHGSIKATTMTYQTATTPTVHTATPSGASGVPFTAYPPA